MNKSIATAFVVIALAAASALEWRASSQPAAPPPRCMDDELREQVRGLMTQAMNEAFKDHIKHTFDIWMKDPGDQPKRARTGVSMGLDAYMRARANVLSWSPPHCNKEK